MFTNVFHFQALLGFATNPPTPLHVDCKQRNASAAIYLHRATVRLFHCYRLNEYVSLHDRNTVLNYLQTVKTHNSKQENKTETNESIVRLGRGYDTTRNHPPPPSLTEMVFGYPTVLIPYVSILIY